MKVGTGKNVFLTVHAVGYSDKAAFSPYRAIATRQRVVLNYAFGLNRNERVYFLEGVPRKCESHVLRVHMRTMHPINILFMRFLFIHAFL